MSDTVVLERLETLARIVERLESRVEELEGHEDLRDLEAVIAENGAKPLVPWEQARKLLDLN